MKYETFEKWKLLGYFVLKGEKSLKRNKKGQAIFSSKQVSKYKNLNYGDYNTVNSFSYNGDYASEKEPETVYYADGSGYINFGGPCGPLYFDRNGNS